jgi:hypothetical protein
MGFLRKVGRKIKKGVKKLFSSKIGAFIGSIALSMIMGPVISRAFNGIKGVFTGAAQKGAETVIQEGAKEVVKEGAKEVVKEGVKDVATKGVIDNTVTGAMEKVVADNTMTNEFLLQAQEGLKGSVTEGMKAAKEGSKLIGDMSKEELAKLASEDLTVGQNIRKGFREVGLGAREFATDPFGKTKEYVGADFIPDALQTVGMEYVKGAMTPEEEQGFGRGVIAEVGAFEPSYMREVQSQMPTITATNFQQMNQGLFFGTLSPQYLAQQAQEMGLAARIPS